MKKQNISRNEELVRKIFVNTVAITRVSATGDAKYELRRIGGSFEIRKLDEVTDAELGIWYFGELTESRTAKRFTILQKRGNALRTVARANCIVECLNALNNIIDDSDEIYTVRFTMEDLARLSQI